MELAILGDKGSVNLPFDSALVSFAQLDFVPPWLSHGPRTRVDGRLLRRPRAGPEPRGHPDQVGPVAAGGRGSAFSALLGTLVIASIASGLTLLNLDSSYRFVITGLVLAVAVAIDSLARKSRTSHGRA